MRSGERAPGTRSNLDKPLEELTDEDIVQLTREDCRRYLKEKGMRRPSWNKSQAIQQVLSLKRLFESRPDDEKKSSKQKPVVAPVDESAARASVPQEKRHGASSSKEAAAIRPKRVTETQGLLADAQIPRLTSRPSEAITECARYAYREIVSAGHGAVPQQSFVGLPSSFPTECPSRIEDRQLHSTLLRSPSFSQPTAQLTIFYSGMVNVYDDIPADKAQAIMLLAGSGNYFSPPLIPNGFATSKTYQGTVYAPSLTNVPMPPVLHANSLTHISAPAAAVSPVPNGTLSELPKSRKASVQRFLKKRKDRGRLKAVSGVPSKKPSFEMYINPHLNSMRSNGRPFHPALYEYHRQSLNRKSCTQSSGSESSSPTRPPQTPRRSSSNDEGHSREQNEDSFNVGSEDNNRIFAGEGEATSASQYSPGKA